MITRALLVGLLPVLLLFQAVAANELGETTCETYYALEMRIIDEQRSYAIQDAILSAETKGNGEEQDERLTERAAQQASKRFVFDSEAARRTFERCVARAKQELEKPS